MKDEYAMYLRKSRADVEAEAKGEGETLARHERILVDFANSNGLKIGKIYKEIVSGETIEARPEVQKLLEDVKLGKWKGVLVVEVERLARGETIDQGVVAKAFKISNTKIITPLKTYNPNNEFDEEYFEFGLFMSRREYKAINRRLQQGRVSSVREGKYVGSIAPFGYDRVKIKGDKGYTLVSNDEANIVKIIYDFFVCDDLSLHEIARRLNDMGLKPRKSNEWCVESIKDILANPVYVGKVKWNARKVVKIYQNEKLINTRPRNKNYILVNGLHKPIIDDRTWNMAQAKRSINVAPVVHKNVVKNPLSGLVICGKCGKKMKRRPYTKLSKEPTLYCDNPNCNNVSSKLYLVEEKIVEGLKNWLINYRIDYEKYIVSLQSSRITELSDEVYLLEKELKKERDKLFNLYCFLEDGTYTKEVFEERHRLITKSIDNLNNLIYKYKQELEIEKSNKVVKNEFPKVESVMDVYDLLETPEEKNTLLKSLLSRVTYLKTEKSVRKDSNPTNFILNLYPKINRFV